jgi:hypothetical protein
VVLSSQVCLEYPYGIAKIFELCAKTTVFIWRHEVTTLVQSQGSKVTEEWAAPICHFLVIFLADKKRPRELMELVKSSRCIGEQKGLKERLGCFLLYGGERNVIGRWMPIKTPKSDQEELLNHSCIFIRTAIVDQRLPVIMNARGKGRLELNKGGMSMGLVHIG